MLGEYFSLVLYALACGILMLVAVLVKRNDKRREEKKAAIEKDRQWRKNQTRRTH